MIMGDSGDLSRIFFIGVGGTEGTIWLSPNPIWDRFRVASRRNGVGAVGE